MKLASAVFAAGLLSVSLPCPGESLLILSKGDRTVASVDPGTLKVMWKAPVGPDPHEVIASADGHYAYVSNYGGGSLNTIAVIDLNEHKALEPIELGALKGPHGLTFVEGKLWFTVEGSKAIARYDPETKKIDWILGTGQNRTHMIYVTPDLKRIYTTNISSGTVSIIEKTVRPGPTAPPGGDWDEVQVPVGRGTEGFDVSPDGKQIWSANAPSGSVSVVDIRTFQVSATLQTPAKGANRLKFTPDGKYVFISSLSGAGLTILDTATRKETKHLDLGRGEAGIQMQPDGARAFVACTGENHVAVIDLRTLSVTGQIDAGPGPDGMAWVK